MTDPRGNPWDFDPGPATTSGWPELFAATPNYRGLGVAVLGRETFRWHFGPMFYRGRLDGAARGPRAGLHRWAGRSAGRVALAPVVHRRHRRADAARAQPHRHQPRLPVPEH